jgi:hypothetical protein
MKVELEITYIVTIDVPVDTEVGTIEEYGLMAVKPDEPYTIDIRSYYGLPA